MTERGVDPQSNVDVILDCLNASPDGHRYEQEEEWLTILGYPDGVCYRWAEATRSEPWFVNLLDRLSYDHLTSNGDSTT